MYQTDYDDFKKTIADLCVAVNRPFNDDLARVFWEDLKGCHLSAVKERSKYLRACGKTRFTSNDLRPERENPQAVPAYVPQPQITWQVRNGNMALLSFMMANDVPQDLVQKLVETKNKIVAGTADDDDTADLSNVLRAAFAKVIA